MKALSYLIRKCSLVVALAVVACDEGDGEGKMRTFSFVVFNGEQLVNGQAPTINGATVEVYSSAQAWADGESPLKTFTTNENGGVQTNDVFEFGAVVYAESGNWNNWPEFLLAPNLNPDMAGTPDLLTGSATVGVTFLSDFESVKNKDFLLNDIRVGGTSIFGNVATCSKDNVVRLQTNGKFLFSEGDDVCPDAAASHEYNLFMYSALKSSYGINNGFYEFNTDWTDVENKIYVKSDFMQIQFRVGDTVLLYNRQN